MKQLPKRNNRIRIFESSIEKLGRILSSKWKIKIIFRHNDCRTDGSTIYLPVLPDNASQDLMDAMQGHLDHETAHVIFTDFSALKKIKRSDKKLFTVANALEDPRIEKKMINTWRGAGVNLRRSLEWSLQKMKDEREITDPQTGKVKKVKPWESLSDFGKVVYTATVFAQVKFDRDHWFLTEIVDKQIADKIFSVEDILRSAVDAKDTHEVVDLSVEFMKRMNEEEEKEEFVDANDLPDDAKFVPLQAPQDASMFKKSEDNKNSNTFELAFADEEEQKDEELMKKSLKVPNQQQPGGIGNEDEETDEEETGSTQSSGVKDSLSSSDKEAKKSAAQQLDMNPSQEDLDRDAVLHAMEGMLKDAAMREFKGTDSYLVYTTEGDKVEIIQDGDKMTYKTFMTEANSMVSVMKRKMSRSLLSTNVSRWEGDKLRGKINPRALFRVPIGTSKRVFREKVVSEDFDTAVQIMVDHSGSMQGAKLDLAAKTSIILGEICNQLNIPFSVIGFSTGDPYLASNRYQAANSSERETYKRWGNLWIGLYKEFDDLWASSNHKLINMVRNAQMNTYDGEALRYGALRLMNRTEKRKILFWLNDGQPEPNSCDDHMAHIEYAKACGQEVEKMVELLAIGVMTDAVKNFYSNYVVVNSIQDLPSVCLSNLDALLRKGKKLTPQRPINVRISR